MKKTLLFLLFIILSSNAIAQNISGILYETNSTAKGILIKNITQKISTYSDNVGFFTINAKINDTIVFGSLFYKNNKIIITPKHFNETIVVELKKSINKLDEIYISNIPVVKEFEAKTYSENIKNQIKEDIKQRPYLYGSQPNGNIDFVALGKLISKLFKRKKHKKEVIQTISYYDLKSLFTTDSFFNESLLFKQLKIPPNYKYLFFEFCEARQINKNLLNNKSNFLLLDALMSSSIEFLEIIETHKKTKFSILK